ncbi:Rho-associated protein kinase [Entamoeba marina]
MRSIVFLSLCLCIFAAEVIVVDPTIHHKDRKALEKKAEKKFALELLKTRKHQSHLKNHYKKKIGYYKTKKSAYSKLRMTLLNEKKEASREAHLAAKKAQINAKKTGANPEKAVIKAIEKAKQSRAKLVKQLNKKNNEVSKLAKKEQRIKAKTIGYSRAAKRTEFKLKKLVAKIAHTKKHVEAKKTEYIKREMRQLERKARVHSIKHIIKKIQRHLDETENEADRKKLINKQKYAATLLSQIAARVRIHKLRKQQRKARLIQIISIIKQLNHFRKGFHYDKKLHTLEVKKAAAIVKSVQKEIETEIQNVALVALEKETTEKENFVEAGERKIRMYKNKIYRLKISDAKIRIAEKQMSKDAAKQTKIAFNLRISKLKKLSKRLGLCPLNRLRIKRRLRIYKKEVKIATRKIKRNNKAIHRLNIRISIYQRKIRQIQKRRIAKIMFKLNHLRRTLQTLRTKIMQVRVRKSSKRKEDLMVKVRTYKNQEHAVKKAMKRFMKRNGHVLRKLEVIRREELEAAKHHYKNQSKALKKVINMMRRVDTKVHFYKRRVANFKHSPLKQTIMMRRMRKYVRSLEKSKEHIKSLTQKKSLAKAAFELLRTKAIKRLHNKRSQLQGKQNWLLSELRALAKKEKDVGKAVKKTTNISAMKSLYQQLAILRKDGKREQLELVRVVKQLQKVNQLFLRHNQYTALRRAKHMFKKYEKKFNAYEAGKLAAKKRMNKYEEEQAELFKKQPYVTSLAGKNSMKQKLRFVKQKMSNAQADFLTLQKQQRRTIRRTLRLNKEYVSLLTVKLHDLKIRLEHKTQERPRLSKDALYSMDEKKQRHAVHRLKIVDAQIEDLDNTIEKVQRKIKKAMYVKGKLNAALKPIGKKCNKQTDCKICRKLGKVAKYGIVHHESDSIILNRLRGVCMRIDANRQRESLHTFDPSTFEVTEVCTQIGKC